jgi:hypothetical protein
VNAVREVVPVHCKTRTEHINTVCRQNVASVLKLAVCILTNELQSVGKATGRGMDDCGSNTRTNDFFLNNNHAWTGCKADPTMYRIFRGTELGIFTVCSALPEYLKLVSNLRRVLNVVCFLLGNSPASEFYMPTFRNILSAPSTYL